MRKTLTARSLVLVPSIILILLSGSAVYAPAVGATDPPAGTASAAASWGVNLHPEDTEYDIGRAVLAFSHIRDLGCRFVRTDFWWSELEPRVDCWNEERFQWFSDYLGAARKKGLQVQVVLTGAPGWARDLYRSTPAGFFEEYQEYCAEVAKRYGARVHYYQMWNEADSILDFVVPWDDWRLFTNARSGLGKYDDDFETYVNLVAGLPWSEPTLDGWMRRAGAAIDIIGLDYYPRTWLIAPPGDWAPLKRLLKKITDPSDPCYGKKAAVQETGFATFCPLGHSEQDQIAWINTSLPALREVVRTHNRDHPNRIISCNWYELIDADTSGGIWPEPHFGILRDDRSKKPAYGALKKRIYGFRIE